MRKQLIILSSLLIATGCSSDPADTDDSATSAGGSASGGSSAGSGGASGGSSASGGSGGVLGNTGGSGGGPAGGGSSGGAGSGGTGSLTGGSGGLGSTGGTTGTGGAGGGSGGMVDMGTGGSEPGGPVPPSPSAGCGKTNPQTGSPNNPLNAGKLYYVKLPTNYDENEPYRVLFMFNPTGGGNTISWAEMNAGYESLSAKDTAIRVYPHEHSDPQAGSPSGWSSDDIPSFAPLYDAIVSNFCVDTGRVFAAGESSGGEFAGFLGCEYGDLFRGVAPGAPKKTSWQIDLGAHDCKGNPAAIVIWSPADNVLNNNASGPEFRDFYHDMNSCGDGTTPVEGYTDDLSNCEMYGECLETSPVYFCQHNDPTYSNGNMPTFHGWPAFAAKMTWEVFSEL